jgi:hypothetical protein
MSTLTPQRQRCNNPCITEQEVERVRSAFGVNADRPAPSADDHVAYPRSQKRAANRDSRHRSIARRFAASAFQVSGRRWGRS